MINAHWLYDATLYIYALSLLFYFSDFLQPSRKAKQFGAGLLIFVWMLQTAYLVMRLMSHLESPEMISVEYWLAFSWLLVTVSLVINRFFYIDYIVFFANVVGFAVLALNLYSGMPQGRPFDVWQTTRDLLYVHISLVLCAYVALTIGALLAGMYLFLHQKLKGKKWSRFIRRFPSLETIETYMDRTVVIGLPLLAMSLAVAATSLLVEGRPKLLLDWKVISSLASLVMFVVYVVQRSVNTRPGGYLAKLYLIAFAILLINLSTSSFSSFH